MGVLNNYANADAVNAALNKGVEANKAVSELKGDLSELEQDTNPLFNFSESTETITTLIKNNSDGQWIVNSASPEYVVFLERSGTYAKARYFDISADKNVLRYDITVRNNFGLVNYFIVDENYKILVTGENGDDGVYYSYSLSDIPAGAKYILLNSKGMGSGYEFAKKFVSVKKVKEFAEKKEVVSLAEIERIDSILYDNKDINLTLSKTSGYAYWKINSGKAEAYTVTGEYFCYYVPVNSGKTYNMKFKYYTYTQPWIVVDDDYNVIQSATTSNYNTNTIYDENITINDGGTKLLLTGHINYTPLVFELNVKTVKDFTIEPIIITVKKDGTGDFATIRGAVDSILDANSETKPYIIEVYPGTYNVFEDYTDAEILSAGTEHYTDSSFVGIKLTDGISLRGIGAKEDIVIHGEVSTDYEQALRNNLSTLNMQGTNFLENVTVTGKYIRYAVHDDFTSDGGANRIVKNCNFDGVSLTSGSKRSSYGMGQRPGDTAYFENCDFGTTFLWHSANVASATKPSVITMINCKAIYCNLYNYDYSVINQVHLHNCNYDVIDFSSSGTTHMCNIDGINTKDYMIACPSGFIYNLGDVTKFNRNTSTDYSIGQMVKLDANLYWERPISPTTNKQIAYGIIIGVTDENYYVQKSGYINSSTLGLSGLSVGDYITVDSNGICITGGTEDNAIGVVKRVNSDVAFIKLLI